MTLPAPERLLAAMDATWPAVRFIRQGPWMLREGQGGGQRVSSATAVDRIAPGEIEVAETAMRELGQVPLFQIRPGDEALDADLAGAGYSIQDPVNLYAAGIGEFGFEPGGSVATMTAWPVPAMARRIWHEGGIDTGRLAVMERPAGPKTAFLARLGQVPAGVAYAAIAGDIAMIHAIEVRNACRRKGVAESILQSFLGWAQDMGAWTLALAVTKENFAANALYAKRRMAVVTHYHYRRGQ